MMILFVLPASLIYDYTQNPLIFLYLIKMPLFLSSLFTSFFIYKIAYLLTNDNSKSIKVASFYALNPLVIILDGTIWGVLDAIPVMFSVASLYYFLTRENNNNLKLSAVLLGCGIATKLYPIFILPAFLVKLKDIKEIFVFIIYSMAPLIIFSTPFLLSDYKSYINILLVHNIGGFHPLFPFLQLSTQSLDIMILFLSIVLFFLAYTKKASIIINVILSLLALYFAIGGNVGSYSLWIVPFGSLLLANKKFNVQRIGKLIMLLPLLYIFIGFLFNGPYNSIEGTTGIFYMTYHILQMKVIVFRSIMATSYFPFLIGIGMSFILLIFIKVIIENNELSYDKKLVERENIALSKPILKYFRRQYPIRYVALIIIIFIAHTLIFSYIIPIRLTENMPSVTSSEFVFFDNFSNSLLNYQWSYIGEGYYTIVNHQESSYLLINSTGVPYNRAAIYRGWGPIWQGFSKSNDSTIEIGFKFISLLPDAHGLIIARTDGGWFGVAKYENAINFVYFDDVNNTSVIIAPTDQEWHLFKITYRSGDRFIYFDGKFITELKGKISFSFLFIGNPDTTAGLGGSCMYDWVQVTIKDFPVKNQNIVFNIFSLLLPLFALLLIMKFRTK
jgi:hypothetical protein